MCVDAVLCRTCAVCRSCATCQTCCVRSISKVSCLWKMCSYVENTLCVGRSRAFMSKTRCAVPYVKKNVLYFLVWLTIFRKRYLASRIIILRNFTTFAMQDQIVMPPKVSPIQSYIFLQGALLPPQGVRYKNWRIRGVLLYWIGFIV